jgi:hypothetical protein
LFHSSLGTLSYICDGTVGPDGSFNRAVLLSSNYCSVDS